MAAAGAGKSRKTQPFPWGQVIHAGLSLLRLSPNVFWALTPVEFFAMTGGMRARGGGLDRAGMDALMGRFPDALPHPQRKSPAIPIPYLPNLNQKGKADG